MGGAQPTVTDAEPYVFFSEVIQVGERCFVCRANGRIVDIFDISPTSEFFASWRIQLPCPLVADVGIAHSSSSTAAPSSISVVLLTKAHTVHRVQILLNLAETDVAKKSSTACSLSSTPSSFCALDEDFVAIGLFDGTLHAFRLYQGDGGLETATGHSEYEFTDASFFQRIMNGFGQSTAPRVLALASLGPGPGSASSAGFRLLCFSVDGQLRLWEALERRGRLLKSLSIGSSIPCSLVDMVCTSMQVNPKRDKACLLLGSSVYLISIGGTDNSLAQRMIEAPFANASPSLVALSDTTLWSFWGGHSREQLFHHDIRDLHGNAWETRALDSNQANASPNEIRNVVKEGCPGQSKLPSPSHKIVFTQFQQQDVWRAEEEGFDVLHLAETLEHRKRQAETAQVSELVDIGSYNESFDRNYQSSSIEDLVLRWWVNRIFLPGRYSTPVIKNAVAKMNECLPQEPETHSDEALRSVVEAQLRRHAAAQLKKAASAEPFNWEPQQRHEVTKSPLDMAIVLANAARAFLSVCYEIWRVRHEVCGLGLSTLWAQHTWFPAGTLADEQSSDKEARSNACPMLLCHGGISCIRAVHSWSERWWATLHLSRDLSNYERMDFDGVLAFSNLDEWKLCATAWFLAQCIGNSNLAFAISLLQRGTLASSSLQRFKDDCPQHLADHVKRCLEGINFSLSDALRTIKSVVDSICRLRHGQASILRKKFDPLRGMWFDQDKPLQAHSVAWQAPELCLSDILRGNIAVSECEYICVAMRDMLLLCVYAGKGDSIGVPAGVTSAWHELMNVLDETLPSHSSLHCSMRLEVQRPISTSAVAGIMGQRAAKRGLPMRGCDLWSSMYRLDSHGRCWSLRPPVPSFQSLQYAAQLLRCEAWDALRWWCRYQGTKTKGFVSYVAGCEFLSTKHVETAREAFLHAQGDIKVLMDLMDCLHNAGLNLADELLRAYARVPVPPLVAYYVQLSKLFGSKGHHEKEFEFIRKAAETAAVLLGNEGCAYALRQMLWSRAYEKAVEIEDWTTANLLLPKIDEFEPQLRILGAKLRSTGRIELMLLLPEKHRTFFLNSLRQHASMSAPIVGSDSLACYNLLYALYFEGQDYLMAAEIAYTLYSELRRPVEEIITADLTCLRGSDSLSWIRTGDCNSDPCDVPRRSSLLPTDGRADYSRPTGSGQPRTFDKAWPLLDQQRNALLMLISALSLTREKLLVMTPQQGALTVDDAGPTAMQTDSGAPAADSAPAQIDGVDMMDTADSTMRSAADYASSNLTSLKDWFSSPDMLRRKDSVISLAEAEKLLATVEAYIVCSGRSALCSPAHAARTVAGLGLLGLALRVASAHDLDLWQFAFQPFTKLCVEAEQNQESSKVDNLARAAKGPAQAYMFIRSDGREPLGQNGDICSGLWQTLEDGLLAVNRLLRPVTAVPGAAAGLDANCTRLYSLVADEVLSLCSGRSLPRFLVKVLSAGPSWVSLLRLYMRHSCVEDSVELLAQQLKLCKSATGKPERCPILQDFPVSLVVQLRNGICEQVAKKTGGSSECLQILDGILTQFQNLLEEDSKRAANLST